MNVRESARILSRGKSFEYSKWDRYIQYTNDCFKQDFVSFNNTLLACIKSHLSSDDTIPLKYDSDGSLKLNSEYWEIVISNSSGVIYIPEYDEATGILSWKISESPESVEPIQIASTSPWENSEGDVSAILGSTNTANGDCSLAAGYNNEASGQYSQAFGFGTKTLNENEVSFGRFNNTTEDTIFSVGNGESDSSRSNIFEITKNGDIYISGRFKLQDLISNIEDIKDIVDDVESVNENFQKVNKRIDQLNDSVTNLKNNEIVWNNVN